MAEKEAGAEAIAATEPTASSQEGSGRDSAEGGGGADPIQLSTAFDGADGAGGENSTAEDGEVSVDASVEGLDPAPERTQALDKPSEQPEANEASDLQSSFVPLQLLEAEKVKASFTEGEVEALRLDLENTQRELEEERSRHEATQRELEDERRTNADLREEFHRFKEIHGGGQSPRDHQEETAHREGPGSGGDVEQLKKELNDARKEISDLEAYTREVDNLTDDLQRQLKEKEKEVEAARRDGAKELGRSQEGSLQSLEDGRDEEVPYDVLDRLDDELARAKEQLLEKSAELDEVQGRLEIVRGQAAAADSWRDSAVQAQGEANKLREELEKALRDGEDERQIRRALEARFEEKLNLKIREAETLQTEVARLKQAGDQLGPVLTELEHLKMENKHKMEHKNKEISRLQAALQVAEAGRQKGENQVRSMRGEMEEWEAKVKAAEEVRWRAGMNLAKAKAEMDWRQKADQEKDFFMERMKEELERLKNKQMRTEMRKLKVEESLEEAVMELRGKKREMEQMRARVEGLVRVLQVQGPQGALK